MQHLEAHHGIDGLKTKFVTSAQNRRGLMGFVLSEGYISVGEKVIIYPPTRY